MADTEDEPPEPGWSWKRPLGPWTWWKWLLVVLFWPATIVYLLMVPGVLLASRAFEPQPSAVQSAPGLRQLQNARTFAGLAAVTVLYFLYTAEGVDAMLDDLLVKTLWAMAIGVVALIAGIALVYSLADADGRHEVRSRLRHPLGTVVTAAGSGAMLWAVTWLATQNPPGPLYFVLLVWGVVQVAFTLRMMFLVTKHVFNSGAVHPLLPALLTPVIACALATVEFLSTPTLPGDIHLVVTLAGTVTVTALAVAEWIVLCRRNPGLSLRDGRW